jgi:glycosyltransferase involved in cell wall biosynthesis
MTAGHLIETVSTAIDGLRGRRVMVVATQPCDRETVEAILAVPGAVGLVLPVLPEGMEGDPRLGTRPGLEYLGWTLPDVAADELLVIGRPRNVGMRAIRPLLRRGFVHLWFADPMNGELYRRHLRHVATSQMPQMPSLVVPPSLRSLMQYGLRRPYEYGKRVLLARLLNQQRDPSEFKARSDRVMLVVGSLGAGGAERQVVNTAISLKQQMLDPVVVFNHGSDETAFYLKVLEEAGIRCIPVDPGAFKGNGEHLIRLGMSRLWGVVSRSYVGQLDAFMHVIEHERPEIVHTFLDLTNVLAGTAAVVCGVPNVVLSMRSVAPDNFWENTDTLRAGYCMLAQSSRAVFSNNSEAGAIDYRRWLGMPRLAISVVPNGIDLAAFEPCPQEKTRLRACIGVPADALLVGGVMRFTEEKRPELWARVAIEISRRHPEAWFVVAGAGPLVPKVQMMFERAGIMPHVRLLGRTSDVASVYRTLDLFLLTSRMEGLPNALIEAQAVGVPVVTTRAGGAAEALKPGFTGLLAEDDSPAGLARLCLDLLEDEARRENMSALAPGWIRQHFALDAMLARTLHLYRAGC